MGCPRLFPRLEIRGFSCSLAELFLAPPTHLLCQWNLGQYIIYITMICITLISIHLQLGLLYKCSKCSIKNWLGGGGGGSATVKLTTDLLQYLCLWGRLLAACDKKKSACLKERDAEEVPLQMSATKEKPLDEKPQAAGMDGGDKSTLLAVTTVHSGQGGGK